MQWRDQNTLPKASRSEGFRKALIRECLRHALQYSLSLNTHKGPISKAANTAPTNDLSLITMPTKTQCVLIGKEQDRKPTAAFIRTEVLSSFFPLLTVRGDAKLGFNFKFLTIFSVRLPVQGWNSSVTCAQTGANRFARGVSIKVASSKLFGK